jgi:hypothetical protein
MGFEKKNLADSLTSGASAGRAQPASMSVQARARVLVSSPARLTERERRPAPRAR